MPEKCGGHGTQNICQESGKVANEYCPVEQVKKISYGGVVPKEKLNLWKPIGSASSTSKEKVDEVCTIHTKPVEEPVNTPTNTINTNTNTTNITNTPTNTTNTNTPANTSTGGNKTNTSTGGNTVGNKTKK